MTGFLYFGYIADFFKFIYRLQRATQLLEQRLGGKLYSELGFQMMTPILQILSNKRLADSGCNVSNFDAMPASPLGV